MIYSLTGDESGGIRTINTLPQVIVRHQKVCVTSTRTFHSVPYLSLSRIRSGVAERDVLHKVNTLTFRFLFLNFITVGYLYASPPYK